MEMKRYKFVGYASDNFGKPVGERWVLETMAKSKKQAETNFKSQIKTRMNKIQACKVTLEGIITEVDR